MDEELNEYRAAVQENIDAAKAEYQAMERKRRAHHRLIMAIRALKDKERELLEETVR